VSEQSASAQEDIHPEEPFFKTLRVSRKRGFHVAMAGAYGYLYQTGPRLCENGV